ncbi:MAG: glycosyltransferase [Bacteroides sp.]|nr:glycosyltransferase [Bacteroides sp.]
MHIKPLVEIRCFTYNQKNFIKETLDGFINQKTNFSFVVLVHDDASDDGTTEIVKEYACQYPDVILPILESENQYSKRDGSLGYVMREASNVTGAKYVAWCEGDDYWIDNLKLQMQVDFLENNPDYGMCYTKVKTYQQNQGMFNSEFGGDYESFKELLLKGNVLPTLTVIARMKFTKTYNETIGLRNNNWPMGDYPLWLFIAAESKIKFLNTITGVYRILDESASHSLDNVKCLNFLYGYYTIKTFFRERYYPTNLNWQKKIDYIQFKSLLKLTLRSGSGSEECLKFLRHSYLSRITKFLLSLLCSKTLCFLLQKLYKFN